MATPLQPEAPRTFTPGPPIAPSAPLLQWLQGEVAQAPGPRRRVRLPVIVRFQDSLWFALRDAFVGTTDTPDGDSLWLALDDTPLGVSLLHTLRARCPGAQPSCAVWLEGYWGPLLTAGPKRAPGAWPFTVLRVLSLLEQPPPLASQVHALVEPRAP